MGVFSVRLEVDAKEVANKGITWLSVTEDTELSIPFKLQSVQGRKIYDVKLSVDGVTGDIDPTNNAKSKDLSVIYGETGILRVQYKEITHKLMVHRASERIENAENPAPTKPYQDLVDFKTEMGEGAFDEDDGKRPLNHFRQNKTHKELTVGGREETYKWALNNNQDAQSDVDGNFSWGQAIERYDYTPQSKQNAYRTLGHILHLMEDMGQPAHVHDDAHLSIGSIGTGGNLIELGDYEDYVRLNWTSGDNLFPATSDIASIPLNTLEEYFNAVSTVGFEANRVAGNLNKSTATASGDMANEYDITLNTSFGFDQWEMHNKASVDPSQTHIGNWEDDGNISADDEWWETILESGGGGDVSGGFFYIEDGEYEYAKPASGGGKTLARIVAEQAVKPVVRHTAGLMKFYHDIVNQPAYFEKVVEYNDGADTNGACHG